jgi:ribosomal protein S18 acetylase RimI-like enzyme
MAPDRSLLHAVDRYLDAAPRAAARTEAIGPFTLFVTEGPGWPYYARPTPGATEFTVADVRAVRARQRALGVPEAVEWVDELAPALGSVLTEAELDWHLHPLMILGPEAEPAIDHDPAADIRVVEPGEDIQRIRAVAAVAFAHPGVDVGGAGPVELDQAVMAARATEDPGLEPFVRDRMARGLTVTVAAFVDGVPVAVGSHQSVESTTEIVGVGTLPAFRRRGLGRAVTAVLAADARARGMDLVFLSAGSDEVARTYARVGFRRAGSAGTAEPPASSVTPPDP